MINKAAYGYKQHTSNSSIKKGQRELEKYQAERKKAAAGRGNQYQETFVRGGVIFNTDQVRDLKPAKVKGLDGFEVEFKNGMVVTFADQTNKKIQGHRYGTVSTIFAHDTNLDVYNVIGGNIKGTGNSENIKLRACYNFDIDGGGGNDVYISKQRHETSNNTYVMNVGDVYEKKGVENFEIEEERDAATTQKFSFTDDKAHKQYLAELKQCDKEIQELKEAKRGEPVFKVDALKQNLLGADFKEQVLKRSEESKKQIKKEETIQEALIFIYNKIIPKMRQAAVNMDESIAKDVEEIEALETDKD